MLSSRLTSRTLPVTLPSDVKVEGTANPLEVQARSRGRRPSPPRCPGVQADPPFGIGLRPVAVLMAHLAGG
jgi:hypothetical protein